MSSQIKAATHRYSPSQVDVTPRGVPLTILFQTISYGLFHIDGSPVNRIEVPPETTSGVEEPFIKKKKNPFKWRFECNAG